MLEKKHLVFLAGATAPFAPPLCTALGNINMENMILLKSTLPSARKHCKFVSATAKTYWLGKVV